MLPRLIIEPGPARKVVDPSLGFHEDAPAVIPPTISVIVRTTGRLTLMDALESLARQTHRDFEVVLVDMSDDRMEKKIEAMHGRLPKLMHLRPPSLLSRPAALNYGIERAQGRYYGVLDDDNYYEPPHLEVLRKGIDQSGADLIYTGVIFRVFTPEGQLIDEQRINVPFDFERLLACNFIFCSASVYSKDGWQRVGGYDLDFPIAEDWEFVIRLTKDARVRTLPGYSAVSRSFTGQPWIMETGRDREQVHRAIAAVHWKHRKLFDRRTRARMLYRKAISLLAGWRRQKRWATQAAAQI
jgi:glycosyltransferase involved in cell wall biosynthesis